MEDSNSLNSRKGGGSSKSQPSGGGSKGSSGGGVKVVMELRKKDQIKERKPIKNF